MLRLAVAATLVLATCAAAQPGRPPELVYAAFRGGLVRSPTVAAAADLFLTEPDGSRRRLTRTAVWEDMPAWSPDGRRVAFSRGDMLCHSSECNEPGASLIFVVPARGGEQRQLYDTDEYVHDIGPAWLPDGRRLAFIRQHPGGGPDGIYVVDVDGSGDPRRLVAGWADALAWSPNGRWLAYVRWNYDERTELRLVDLRSGRGRTLAVAASIDQRKGLAWSPDGRRLALADPSGLRLFTLAGGKTRRLLRTPSASVSWSPDGRQLVVGREPPYSSERARQQVRIVVVDSDGRRPRKLDLGPGSQFAPSWRP
jgi:Tol biopolymer transport system component